MNKKQNDAVLDAFDLFRQLMEEIVGDSTEVVFRARCADVGKNLWWFMDEMMKAGFTNTQAFILMQSIVLKEVTKNG